MRLRCAILVVTRLALGATLLGSSLYCLLAFVPFTYIHFLQFSHFRWLTAFVRLHPVLFVLAFAPVAFSMLGRLHQPSTRRLTAGFLFAGCGTMFLLLVRPVLGDLENGPSSFVWSLFFLLPLVWVGAIDLSASLRKLDWVRPEGSEERRLFWTSTLTAAFAAGVSFLGAWARGFQAGEDTIGTFAAFGWTLILHLVLFMALFVLLALVHVAAGFFGRPVYAELVLYGFVASGLTALGIYNVVLSSISFSGPLAGLYAFAVGLSLVVYLLGLGTSLFYLTAGKVASGLAPLLRAVAPGPSCAPATRVIWLLAVGGAAYGLGMAVAPLDWDFRVQQLLALALMVLTFSSLYLSGIGTARASRRPAMALLFVPLATVALFRILPLGMPASATADGSQIAAALHRYSGYDVSYRLLSRILAPPSEPSLYRFLQDNSNIPPSVAVEPVSVNLVEHLQAASGPLPNIFIFTIDSLRQDYLSVYNDQVSFTPEIQEFGADSIIFRNAFTRYGATGLSEPSIWVGGLMLHKQYITPFYPMNALQRLLEVDGYSLYLGIDSILSRIVQPSAAVVDLNQTLRNRDFPLCDTLQVLRQHVDTHPRDDGPIFAYVQPQDIHISVLNRSRESVPAGEDYPGFHAPYAAAIRRMDGCFGSFIEYLKTTGLYANSIVILTSDHGDSLGEGGRWGHAYTIFPEILRVPLIVHLPEFLRRQVTWDEHLIAFTSDITPSLYYLLGHRPIVVDPVLGRPLFTQTPGEARQYLQDAHLVASSYGPNYGILSQNGHRLFIADGVNFRDYLFDLRDTNAGTSLTITETLRSEYYELIRERVQWINRFYGFSR